MIKECNYLTDYYSCTNKSKQLEQFENLIPRRVKKYGMNRKDMCRNCQFYEERKEKKWHKQLKKPLIADQLNLLLSE